MDIEREIKNLVLLQRFANGLARDGGARLRAVVAEIAAELARHDPTSVMARYRRARLEKALEAIAKAVAKGYKDIEQAWRESLVALGVSQAGHVSGTLGAAGVPVKAAATTKVIRKLVREAIIDGRTLSEWVLSARRSYITDVTRALRLGVEHGDDADTMMRQVRDATRKARRHIDGIARTTVTATTNRAHLEVYRGNADVLDGVRFLATLDSRTTILCASLDGTEWQLDDPDMQIPPLHFNCRSQLVPVIDWSHLGADAPPRLARAAEGGPFSGGDYEDWFAAQTPAKQDAIIGKRRADLFRRKLITFRDMVTRDNRVVPVDDLP